MLSYRENWFPKRQLLQNKSPPSGEAVIVLLHSWGARI
jgi:hypothetical protein